MTTSPDKPFLSTLLPKERPPAFVLGYLRSSFLNRLHQSVLSVFVDLEQKKQISKAELARRLDKDPSLITRWLSGPGNWELGTVSDLLAGMGYEPDIRVVKLGAPSAQQNPEFQLLPSRQEPIPADNEDVFDPDKAFNTRKAEQQSNDSTSDLGLRPPRGKQQSA